MSMVAVERSPAAAQYTNVEALRRALGRLGWDLFEDTVARGDTGADAIRGARFVARVAAHAARGPAARVHEVAFLADPQNRGGLLVAYDGYGHAGRAVGESLGATITVDGRQVLAPRLRQYYQLEEKLDLARAAGYQVPAEPQFRTEADGSVSVDLEYQAAEAAAVGV